jgi:hypothetical protein
MALAISSPFPDEANDYADRVLVALEGHAILVPAHQASATEASTITPFKTAALD